MHLVFIWLVLSTFELGTYMAANTANVTSVDQALDLNNIRSVLRRMEDSIIFSLIERSQYRVNNAVYEPNYKPLGRFKLHQLKSSGSNGCLGDWFIYQTECLHSQVKRYEHPTEFSFFKPLPEPSLGQTISEASPTSSRGEDGSVLAPVPPEAVVNPKLLEIYRTKMIPSLCEEGDDGNYGSTAVQDVHVLQTISTRIYYGLFVAESKFRSEREKATELIKARDEAKAFSRNIGGQADEGNGDNTTYKVNPEYIGTVFEDYIMPLTKEVEVAYLLARLDETERPDPEKESTAWFGTASGSGKLKKTLQEDLNIRADQL